MMQAQNINGSKSGFGVFLTIHYLPFYITGNMIKFTSESELRFYLSQCAKNAIDKFGWYINKVSLYYCI